MDLEKIQSLWEEDSKIDPDNLHTESLKIPQLHAKYYKIYNTLSLAKKKLAYEFNELKRFKWEYYSGRCSKEVYEEHPWDFKVLKQDIPLYLESDKELLQLKLKIDYYDSMLSYLEEIIKTITNRSFQIKNAIEWCRFTEGYQ